MIATDRLDSERIYHDLQARQRAETFRRDPGRLLVRDGEYLDHESWIRPAFGRLGNVSGKRVLDYGCGHGIASVVLAWLGANVTAFDLSADYLREARLRSSVNDAKIQFVQADAHHLPFADSSFDAIWGHAILHHLDLSLAGEELRRVLRPGGIAVFCEPWGGNPLLRWARRWLPYPGKGQTEMEAPLQRKDLEVLTKSFPRLEWDGFQLFSMAGRALPLAALLKPLDRIDRVLLRSRPKWKNWCRYVVLTLRR
jgi:SAM-dependent methyltransferase